MVLKKFWEVWTQDLAPLELPHKGQGCRPPCPAIPEPPLRGNGTDQQLLHVERMLRSLPPYGEHPWWPIPSGGLLVVMPVPIHGVPHKMHPFPHVCIYRSQQR